MQLMQGCHGNAVSHENILYLNGHEDLLRTVLLACSVLKYSHQEQISLQSRENQSTQPYKNLKQLRLQRNFANPFSSGVY